MAKPRFSLDEIARLGDAIYECDVLPNVAPADNGRYVAIDVISGAFALDVDQLAAADAVRARNPAAQIWFRRVGRTYVHRFRLHA